MRYESTSVMATARRALGMVAGALMVATSAHAQAASSLWRVGFTTGGYVPLSSLIVAADSYDTLLEAGPAFTLEAQRLVRPALGIYASGVFSFGSIQLGSTIRPTVLGPSTRVMVTGITAGVQLSPSGWLGAHVQPTLRLGGGFKYYSFDLVNADNQLRPTGDLGVGLRGSGMGPLEVTAEVRYLPSSFDQAKLPTRGVTPQDQRQNDVVFAVGFSIRP